MSDENCVPTSARLSFRDHDYDFIDLLKLHGREALSQPYRFDLTMAARANGTPAAPSVADLLGLEVSVELLNRQGEAVNKIHGTIFNVQMYAASNHHYSMGYQIVVMPRFWRLSMVKMQEIYMDLSVPEIIEKKLTACGLEGTAGWGLLETYPKREFVVQYAESDLAFVNRLTEHLGISYFFEQQEHNERVVFTDHQDGFSDGGSVRYNANGADGSIHGLVERGCFVTRTHIVHDYNYRTPTLDLLASERVSEGSLGGLVEYGTHHKTPADAKQLAKVRAEESAVRRSTFSGTCRGAQLRVGARVRLTEHKQYDEQELLITSIEHSMTLPQIGGDEQIEPYVARFDAARSELTYRPPRVTPRPTIGGVITGIIQRGPNGESRGFARVDELGRYTVQFQFDTFDATRPKASRPVRMAQAFTGAREGMHFPLRPGTEVLIAFANGDPDRPVILSAIPNGVDVSPVVGANSNINRIATASGTLFEISDGR